MTQTDKKESSIFDIYNIKDQIKTLIVNYIKDQQIEIVSTLEKDIEIIEHKENDYVYQTLPVIIDINAYRIIFDISYTFNSVYGVIKKLYITFNPGTYKEKSYNYIDNDEDTILGHTDWHIIPELKRMMKKQTATHHESSTVLCVKSIMQREMAKLAKDTEYSVSVIPITTDPIYNGPQIVTTYIRYTISCLVYSNSDKIPMVDLVIELPNRNKKYFEDIPFLHMDQLSHCIGEILKSNLTV